MKEWYVVHTQVHGEERARVNLERQGYEVWLPRYKKRRRHARRVEEVTRPLFPRYLFLRLDLAAERWRPVLSTFGVRGLIGGGQGPLKVPEAVMTGLKARVGADGLVELAKAVDFKAGDRVRVSGGPLLDLDGIFEAATDAERVSILLDLLGRRVRVTVPVAHIEPA